MSATFQSVKPGFILSTQRVGSAPFVHLTFTVRRGSECEGAAELGYLNLLGTMISRGCGKLDRGAFANDCDSRGANVQVYPSRDFFTLEVWVLPEDLEWALETMENMLWQPLWDPVEVDIAVEEQLSQLHARKDEKRSVIWDVCRQRFFRPEHHYSRNLLGDDASLDAAGMEALEAFRTRFLHQAEAVLCVTGGFDEERLARALKSRFQSTSFAPFSPNGRASCYQTIADRVCEIPFPVNQAEVLVALPAMARQAEDYRLGLFCNEVFGGAFLSRLTRAVRMREGMAYSAESRIRSGLDGGTLWIGLQTDVDRLPQALRVVRACMDELAEEGLPESEFNHFQEFVTHSMPFDYDGISDLTSRRLEQVLFNEPWSLEDRLQHFRDTVSRDKTNALCREMLKPGEALVCILGEGMKREWGEAFFEPPTSSFVSSPLEWIPEPEGNGGSGEPTLIHTHREGQLYKLSNGIPVLCLPRLELASISLQVWTVTGAMDEGKGHTGLSHLLEHLMFRGTPNVPDGQFDAILAQRGGLNNAFTTEDFTVYLDQVTLGGLESALNLEADRFSRLDISEELFSTELSVVLEERSMRIDCNPLGKAYETLQYLAFGDQHPYGHPVIGWREDLEACRLEDMRRHYRYASSPERLLLVIAGGCPSAEAVSLAERAFGRLGGESKPVWPVRAPDDIPRLEPASETMRDRSGYSYLLLCYRFPRAGHPDYEACELLSRVLGEGDSCRLYEVFVRERKRVQEVWMNLEPQSRDHPLVHFGVATAEELDDNLADEIKRYLDEVPDQLKQEELDKASRVWFSEDAFSRDDLEDWALEIAGRVVLMDWDEVWGQRERMNAVTLDDLRRVARCYLSSQGAVHVVLHGES
ncbi:MAG: insulinase family protein [Candidatus Eremiobacteraeota bacterium]|nr:insulinase family protein [Candidatus Eremiobacteraeota bacterium]